MKDNSLPSEPFNQPVYVLKRIIPSTQSVEYLANLVVPKYCNDTHSSISKTKGYPEYKLSFPNINAATVFAELKFAAYARDVINKKLAKYSECNTMFSVARVQKKVSLLDPDIFSKCVPTTLVRMTDDGWVAYNGIVMEVNNKIVKGINNKAVVTEVPNLFSGKVFPSKEDAIRYRDDMSTTASLCDEERAIMSQYIPTYLSQELHDFSLDDTNLGREGTPARLLEYTKACLTTYRDDHYE